LIIGACKISCCNKLDKLRNPDIDRTAPHARFRLTLQTSFGLFYCHFFGIAQGNF
jgi:hypothetical protein